MKAVSCVALCLRGDKRALVTAEAQRGRRPQPKHPERMKVNSRGRAASCEAHGSLKQQTVDPERVKQRGWAGSTPSGSDRMTG